MTEVKIEPKMEFKKTNIEAFGRYYTGTPLISEYFGSNPWISFGPENDFPQEIIRLYQNASPMHRVLIDRKVDMIAGKGFDQDTPFIKNEYFKEDLNEIATKVAYDKVIFNGFYLMVSWDKTFKSISRIQHLPYEKMRIAKYDCDSKRNPYQSEGFYFSKDWLNHRRKDNYVIFYPEYDVIKNEDKEYRQNNPDQVMFFKTYSPGMDYYTLPSYMPALNDIKTSYEISTYHLKNIQNGFAPQMIIINKSGIPTPEQREEERRDVVATMTGAENTADITMVYAENAEKAPEFVQIQPNSSDQRFRDLRMSIASTIMQVHKFTSAIAGIETSGKLGSSQEIIEQLEYMQSTVVSPIQSDIEKAFMKVAKINGQDETLTLKKYTIFDLAKSIENNQIK